METSSSGNGIVYTYAEEFDEVYWLARVKNLVSSVGSPFPADVQVNRKDIGPENTLRVFIDNANRVDEDMMRFVRKKMPSGCNLCHAQIKGVNPRTGFSGNYTALFVAIPESAQISLAKSREPVSVHVLYAILFLLLVLEAVAVYNLWYHWSGYKEPWKNILKYAKFAGASPTS